MGKVEEYCNAGRKVSKYVHNIHNKVNGRRDLEFLESLVLDVEKNVDGRRVMIEGEDDEDVVMQR
jgi:hypothetical protein